MQSPPSPRSQLRAPPWARRVAIEFRGGGGGGLEVEASRLWRGVSLTLSTSPSELLEAPRAAEEVARAAAESVSTPLRGALELVSAAVSLAILAVAAYLGAPRGWVSLLAAVALALAAVAEIVKALAPKPREPPLWLGVLAVEAARAAAGCRRPPCRGILAAAGDVYEYTVERGLAGVAVALRRRLPDAR